MKRVISKLGAMPCIIVFLGLSGFLRIGGVGLAVASEPELRDTPPLAATTSQTTSPDIEMMLAAIVERNAELDAKAERLAIRAENLNAAQTLVEENLRKLAEAEERLANTIARVDGASESDLERLTAVYESMKPKVAATLFEQMTPEFAAGFLGRMNPESAAGIMSGLSTDVGYAISVVLAGRNAKAPKK